MKGCMGHHLTSPIVYSLNISLSFANLMLVINTRETLNMFLPFTIRAEVIRNTYAVVIMVTLGLYANKISDPVFK